MCVHVCVCVCCSIMYVWPRWLFLLVRMFAPIHVHVCSVLALSVEYGFNYIVGFPTHNTSGPLALCMW